MCGASTHVRARWGEGGGHGSVTWFPSPSIRPTAKNESFMTISGLARLTHVTAGCQFLKSCHFNPLRQTTQTAWGGTPPPSPPSAQGCYNRDNMAKESWTQLKLIPRSPPVAKSPKNSRFLFKSESVPRLPVPLRTHWLCPNSRAASFKGSGLPARRWPGPSSSR